MGIPRADWKHPLKILKEEAGLFFVPLGVRNKAPMRMPWADLEQIMEIQRKDRFRTSIGRKKRNAKPENHEVNDGMAF